MIVDLIIHFSGSFELKKLMLNYNIDNNNLEIMKSFSKDSLLMDMKSTLNINYKFRVEINEVKDSYFLLKVKRPNIDNFEYYLCDQIDEVLDKVESYIFNMYI